MTTYLSLRNVQNFNTSTLTASTVIGSTINFTSNVLTLGPSAGATQSATLSNGTWSTWTATKTSMSNVKKIAVSSTGQYQLLLLTVAGTSALWLSSDSGATWSLCTAYGLPSGAAYSYTSAAISADGRYITIGVYGDLLYVSSDSGATFNNPQAGTAPYAWLRFENSFTDTMGNSTITPTTGANAPTFSSTVVPNAGQSYSMRLTNTAGGNALQYVRGTWAGSPNFTVSFWMNPQQLNSTYQQLFSAYAGAFKVTIADNNTLYVAIPSGGGTGTANIGFTSALTTNTWYYVTAIFQTNGLCSFYVNNTLIASVINSGGVGSFTSSVFSLGTYNFTTGEAFNGYIDDFRLTNSAITYQNVPLSPYAWLKFENAVTDTMGAVTPTVTGSVTYVPGTIGRSAVNLANTAGGSVASGNYVSMTYTPPTNFTISGWFNAQTIPGSGVAMIFSGGTGAATVYQLYITTTGVLTFNNNTTTSTITVSTNTWYQFSLVYQTSGTCYIYVNGVQVGSVAGAALSPTPTIFNLGTYTHVNTTGGFNGYIDDFRIYPFALTPPNASTAQIMTLPSNWSQIALSGSGQYQLAGTDYGQVYKSTDYGATWTASTGSGQAGSTGCVRNLALSHSGQYQLVSAQKWVTPNNSSASATSWYQSGATWIATASSTYSAGFPSYQAFDNSPNNAWASGNNTYTITTGVYAGAVSTTVLGGVGAVAGEWLQLQSSVPIVLSGYTYIGGGLVNQNFKNYLICGSTDGINWYPLQDCSMTTNPLTVANGRVSTPITLNYTGVQSLYGNQAGSVTTTAYPFAMNSYTYFRLIVKTTWGEVAVTIGEFYPNFLAATNVYTPQQTGLSPPVTVINGIRYASWQSNGVGYTSSASTVLLTSAPYAAFCAFDNIYSYAAYSSWVSNSGYNSSTGSYNYIVSTTVQNIGAVLGEYLQIQTSVPLLLSSYTYATGRDANGLPKTGYIVGSNDGLTWYPLQYFNFTTNPFTTTWTASNTYILVNYTGTQAVYGNQAGSVTTTSYSTSATPYTYFRIICSSLFSSNLYNAEIAEWFLTFLGGQSYSTNYGSTWTTVPTTYLAGPTAVSGNGQYQIGVNNTPLIARLTLDNTATDSMGGLTAATGAGSVTYSTSIKQVGTHSAQFSNTAGVAPSVYLNYTVPTVLNQPAALTMACWVYPTTAGDTVPLCLTNAVTNYGPNFNLKATGQVNLNVWNTANSQTTTQSSTGAVLTNTWTHLVATIGNNTQSLYINGVLIGTTAFSGIIAANTGVTINNVLVGTGTSTSFAFAGYVDDVRLYTSALTAAQVAALYADATTTVQSLAVTSNYLAGLSSNPSNPVTLNSAAAFVDTATSYTGQYMIAVTAATSGSNVYYSTNYGATWTGLSVGLATAPLVSCAMSYDGTYATVASTTTVYTLNNNTTGFTVAVGAQAGQTNQASQAIAIGNKAGQTNQAASSIVLNATGSTLTAAGPGFYVGPVQAAAAATTAAGFVNLLGYGADSQIVQNSSASINAATGGLRVITGTAPNTSVSLADSSSLMLDRSDGGWNTGDLGAMLMFRQLWFSGLTGASNVIGTGGISGFKSASNGNFGGGLGFHYCPFGQGNLVQGMCLNHSGYLGIGTNAPANPVDVFYNSSRAFAVATTGTLTTSVGPLADNAYDCGWSGARWRSVWSANGTIQTSDSNQKDAQPLPYGINEVLQMRTIKYKWKSQADLPDTDPQKNFEYYGFCADELAPIFPELVYDENKEVPVQMNYSEILPVVVNAIKEEHVVITDHTATLAAQQTTMNDHTATLAALQSTITALQAQVSTLVSSSAPAPSTSSDSTTASSSSSDSTTTSSTQSV